MPDKLSAWRLVLAMLLLMMRSAWHVDMPSAMVADVDDGVNADTAPAADATADAELFGSEVDLRSVVSSAMVSSPGNHTSAGSQLFELPPPLLPAQQHALWS